MVKVEHCTESILTANIGQTTGVLVELIAQNDLAVYGLWRRLPGLCS
jgi:hypothetical protein